MKLFRITKKCAVCGVENEYSEVMSAGSFRTQDFDLKPNNSMLGFGNDIQECPNCHYCNYDISYSIEGRFDNNYELWKNNGEIQDLINNRTDSERRLAIVLKQYLNNSDYKKAYNVLLKLYWLKIEEKNEEESRLLLNSAIDMFKEKLFPDYINELMQSADLLRMNSDFAKAKRYFDALSLLCYEDERIKKIIDFELEFVGNNDNRRHNLSEIE